jgi:CheY-like chemotaxis protein
MPQKDGIKATKEIREFFDKKGISREDQPKIVGITGHVLDSFKNQGI